VQRPPATTSDVVNPAPFLSGALIPAAAIITGVGLVVRRRMERQTEECRDDQ
jgi:hypothetical protein